MRLNFCVLCEQTDLAQLQHHHFIPRALGGKDDETNLITLCVNCHATAHDRLGPFPMGELIRQGTYSKNQRPIYEKKASAERRLKTVNDLVQRLEAQEEWWEKAPRYVQEFLSVIDNCDATVVCTVNTVETVGIKDTTEARIPITHTVDVVETIVVKDTTEARLPVVHIVDVIETIEVKDACNANKSIITLSDKLRIRPSGLNQWVIEYRPTTNSKYWYVCAYCRTKNGLLHALSCLNFYIDIGLLENLPEQFPEGVCHAGKQGQTFTRSTSSISSYEFMERFRTAS